MSDQSNPDVPVLVELVGREGDPAAISFEQRVFDRMENWVPKLNMAMARLCELVEVPVAGPRGQQLEVKELSISFSVSFSVEGSILVGRAGSEGSVEVGCTFVASGSN